MNHSFTRRQCLTALGAAAVPGIAAAGAVQPAATNANAQSTATAQPAHDSVRFCLNTATIRGQNIPIADEVAMVARAGYQAIEPWINELERHVQQGGNLRDLGRRISDAGLRVPSAIGFAEWIVDDDAQRKRGLERARRDMDMVRQIGGTHIAAPPAGATNVTVDPRRAAERYRALLEVGVNVGVIPQVEIWGFSRSLSRLSETATVAIEADHPRACILADVYHLHKGGSGFNSLRQMSGAAMNAFHVNDYPATPARAEITDAHRVHAGDGVAPLAQILRDLRQSGFHGYLSLELFNREYWKQDAAAVLRTGLERMQAAVRASNEARR